MSWLVFAILAMIVGSFREIAEKRALQNEHTLEYLVARGFFITIFSLFLIPFVDFNISWEALLFIGIVAALAAPGMLLHRKALKHLEVSVVDPLLNLSTIFVLILAFLFLGEKVTLLQLGGILLLVVGTYVLEVDHEHHGLLAPFKKLFESKYTIMLLGAATVFAVTNTFDRLITTTYADPITYLFIVWIMMNTIYFVWHGIQYRFKGIVTNIKRDGGKIVLPALFNFMFVGFLYGAMELTTSAALVVAVFRIRSLITTIEGGKFFHESQLFKKSIACSIMVVGAIMVLL